MNKSKKKFRAIFIGNNVSELGYGTTGFCEKFTDSFFQFFPDGRKEVFGLYKNEIYIPQD